MGPAGGAKTPEAPIEVQSFVSSASSRRRTTEPIPRLITSEASFESVMLAKPFNTALDMIFLKHSVNRSKSARMWPHLASWLHPRQEVTPSLISHRLPQKVQGSSVTCFSSPNRSKHLHQNQNTKRITSKLRKQLQAFTDLFYVPEPRSNCHAGWKRCRGRSVAGGRRGLLGNLPGSCGRGSQGYSFDSYQETGKMASHPRSKNTFVSPAYNSLLSKAPSGIAPSRATRNSSLHGIRIPEHLVVVLMFQRHVQVKIM